MWTEGDDVHLSWSGVTQSIAGCLIPTPQYNIYYTDTGDNGWTLLNTISDTTFTDTAAVSASVRRSYLVTALTSGEVLVNRVSDPARPHVAGHAQASKE